MTAAKHMLVTVDGASAPEVAHVVSEHYLGYGVDGVDVSGVDVFDAVAEGWWHPNCKGGQVHDHPERPGGNWSVPMHRLCELVYSARRAQEAGH